MKTTADTAKPMTLGIDERPITRSANGIQNHTTATAPPTSRDALAAALNGRVRGGAGGSAWSYTSTGAVGRVSVSVTADMTPTYGPTRNGDTAFSRDSPGG